ncbi:MAG TPA: hypothetical protein VEA69_18100 [Tepidisphaeraceae bacterium]|nr:hypothetical protein [Tepidisphaeraceae bacterium]
MSTIDTSILTQLESGRAPSRAAAARTPLFVAACLTIALAAAALAGLVPLGFSIVTVFLFAGPHNYLEFRYFLTRMPAHWGPMRGFFLAGIGGVLALTAAFLAMPVLGRHFAWDDRAWAYASASWNSALVLWIAALVRRHFSLRRESDNHPAAAWAFPAALLLVAGVWAAPHAWEVALVYTHPLVALWFLDRELGRRRPAWRTAYRACLALIPVLIALIWWRLHDAPALAGQDMLSMRITRHAGSDLLTGVSAHALVATHTFLEMLHYGVWVVAIPLIATRTAPWRLGTAPLVRRSRAWRLTVVAALALGALTVLTLWGGFLADYPLTRDLYFTVAIAHVLAEVPFLLRTF